MTLEVAQELDGGAIESIPDEDLDAMDCRLLDCIQSGFPIAPRPYAVLGQQLGLSEEETCRRVRRLQAKQVIRRIGANFQSAKLGFRSTLCAAKVPADRMDAFVQEVNSHVGITHNYLRDHEYNVWFTCIGPSWQAVCDLLDEITQKTGIPILNLPAKRTYKIKVDFPLSEQAAKPN